jgi:hemolysin activation/secretion protein
VASVPALKVDSTPRAKQIEANIRVANENPSKKTQVFLKSTDQPGEIDATVQVADQKPSKVGVIVDNTGTPETGDYRVGVFYQNSNVANKDQVLTMQLSTTPERLGRVKIFGAGYHIPLYALGDSVDVTAGYADVNSGVVQNLFNVSGSGTILGARYNHNLERLNDYDHKLSFGLDYRAYRNNVQVVGTATSLVPNVTVHPVSVSYIGEWHPRNRYVSFYVSEALNLPGGAQGGTADFAATRTNARADYRLTRYGIDYTQAYQGDWQTHLGFSGQYTADALVPGEQFGVGGESSVRGFYERELANDKGYRGTVELFSPDFGSRVGGNVKQRALVFYDFADISRNKPLAGEIPRESIGSVGIGLRTSIGSNFSLLTDLAQVVDAGGRHGKYDKRLQVSLVMIY